MVRTVRVDLEADVGKYIPPVEESTKATEGLNRKIKDTDEQLNKIPPDAAKAAAAMKLFGDESGKAGLKLDDLGKRSTSLGAIDERIAHTRVEVQRLAEEFNRTGDAGILGRLFGAQSDLKQLENLKSRVSGALEQGAADGGREGAKSFTAAMEGGLSTPGLGPILVGVLVAAALAAAPALGGALIGGAGIGAIAAGVVGQLHDPQVHQAFVDIGHDASKTLTDSTAGFKQPLIAGAREIKDALHQVIAGVDWKAAADDVAPLVHGLTSLVLNIMPGLNKMLAASGPILGAMSNDLAVVGSHISAMFDLIAQGGKGGQEALRALLYLVAGLAVGIGGLVLGLEKLVEWTVAGGQALADFFAKGANAVGLSKLAIAFGEIGDMFRELNGSNDVGTAARAIAAVGIAAATSGDDLTKLSGALNEVTDATSNLAARWTDKLFGEMMGLDQATLHWHESLTSLNDTLSKNGLAIDRHTHLIQDSTKVGEENRSAILASVQANEAQYQAMVAGGISAQDAARAYDANTASLEKQLHAAGYTAAQVDDLIGKYRNVPDKVNTALAVSGLTAAINNLGALEAEIHNLDGREFGFTVRETQLYDVSSHPAQREGNAKGGIYEHAATGLLRDAKVFSPVGPARYAFAEPSTGGEAFIPRIGDYGRSTAILDRASRWYGGRFMPAGAAVASGGGNTYQLTVYALDPRQAGPVVIEAIKSYERSNGPTWRTSQTP